MSAGLAAAPAAMHGTASAWRTYRDSRAGYMVRYPASWTLRQGGASGSLSTVFAPRHGGGTITVTVLPSEPDGPQISDVPNGHCQAIQNSSGLAGMRCFDTLSFNTYTVYFGPTATYRISVTGKGGDKVYNRLVQSFRLISS